MTECWAGAHKVMTAHALAFLSIQPARFVLTLLQCTAAAQAVQQQQIFADALTGYVAECRVPIQKMVCDAFAAVIKYSRAPACYSSACQSVINNVYTQRAFKLPLGGSTIRVLPTRSVVTATVATPGAASSSPGPVGIIPPSICVHLVNGLGPLHLSPSYPGVPSQVNQVLYNTRLASRQYTVN